MYPDNLRASPICKVRHVKQLTHGLHVRPKHQSRGQGALVPLRISIPTIWGRIYLRSSLAQIPSAKEP